MNWIGWYWQNDGETTWTSMGCDGSTDCDFGPTRSGHAEYRYRQEGSDTVFSEFPNLLTGTAAVCGFRARLPAAALAVFHTHGFQLTEQIPPPFCGTVPGEPNFISRGPSPLDAVQVQRFGIPGYVMDGGNVYRLVPGFGIHSVGPTSEPNDTWQSAAYLTTYSRGPACHYP
jgi:hypothetical protein